ncbi:MAG: serine hydrolase domain-containing protein [Actinomycetota bacterium]|nr:serine hydrolase [Acidimicrobiaceae bacterium]MEC7384532.1 serine hydrolase domain-containing protein [Actinomycetota bacterium]MEC7666513.1 serine hydrolase domain-containing protein [Actinomycetota bacterium]MEC8018980.1 serine hydrolase domain-containing protein [Actinomycetota bacterium]MEC8486983.1 serine hydrolase domain-containing protein [Actinomycetota bacterium]
MAEIQGVCDPRFEAVHQLLYDNLDSGADTGASVAVMLGGELVVDLWGGSVAANDATPWQHDTIVNVWSTTKTMMALSALLLVDRGLLDVDAPVSTYWPEFAQNGKEHVRVRQFLGHTSGISGWEKPITLDEVLDWELSTEKLAAQAPWWEPGTQSGYHAMNQGHLVGEVVRRISGMKLGEFFRKEIAEPFDIDFHIGLSEDEFGRVATLTPPPPPSGELRALGREHPAIKTFTGPLILAKYAALPEWRAADIPAANGHGNARSVAQAQSVISTMGKIGDTRVMSQEAVEEIFRVQADGFDLVLQIPVTFGLGYGLPNETTPYLPDRRVCFWCGYGGSMIVNDLDNEMTVAYVMNRMDEGLLGDARGHSIVAAALAAVA